MQLTELSILTSIETLPLSVSVLSVEPDSEPDDELPLSVPELSEPDDELPLSVPELSEPDDELPPSEDELPDESEPLSVSEDSPDEDVSFAAIFNSIEDSFSVEPRNAFTVTFTFCSLVVELFTVSVFSAVSDLAVDVSSPSKEA